MKNLQFSTNILLFSEALQDKDIVIMEHKVTARHI